MKARYPILVTELFLSMLLNPLQAAIVLDSTTNVNDIAAPYELTGVAVANNPNRILIIGVSQREPNINNITACTFNTSETMTKLTSLDGTGTSNINVSIWYLKTPSATTASVTCTASNTGEMVIGSLVFYNVDLTNTFRGQPTNGYLETAVTSNTSHSLDLTTVAGDMCFSVQIVGDTATITNLAPGGSAVERWDTQVQSGGGRLVRAGGSTLEASGTSTTMSWSWTTSDVSVLITAALQPAATASPLFKRYYDLLRSSLERWFDEQTDSPILTAAL